MSLLAQFVSKSSLYIILILYYFEPLCLDLLSSLVIIILITIIVYFFCLSNSHVLYAVPKWFVYVLSLQFKMFLAILS